MKFNQTGSVRKKSTAIALGLALAATLTGCYKTEAKFEISKDDKVSGAMVFALSDKAWATMAELDVNADGSVDEADETAGTPLSTEEYIAVMTAPEEIDGTIPAGVVVSPFRGDGYSGYSFDMDSVSFKNFNKFMADGGDGLMAVRRLNSKTIKFAMPVDAYETQGVPKGFPIPVYKVKLGFPGKVLSTNGKVSGKTVSWNVKAGAKEKALVAVAKSAK